MDLLLAEIERGAALAHTLGLHPEHALIKLHDAVDIGDGEIEVVDAFDLHGRPRRFAKVPRLTRNAGFWPAGAKSCKIPGCCPSAKPAFWPAAGSVIWRLPMG